MSAPFTDIPNMTLHLAGLLLKPAPTPQVKKLEEMPLVALLQTLWSALPKNTTSMQAGQQAQLRDGQPV